MLVAFLRFRWRWFWSLPQGNARQRLKICCAKCLRRLLTGTLFACSSMLGNRWRSFCAPFFLSCTINLCLPIFAHFCAPFLSSNKEKLRLWHHPCSNPLSLHKCAS